jgi:hypothetical protein
VPSGFRYQPSYAGVTDWPDDFCVVNGSCACTGVSSAAANAADAARVTTMWRRIYEAPRIVLAGRAKTDVKLPTARTAATMPVNVGRTG